MSIRRRSPTLAPLGFSSPASPSPPPRKPSNPPSPSPPSAPVPAQSNSNTMAKPKPRPGSLRMHDVTVHTCIKWAYGVQDNQIAGPAWLDSERYDLVAKADTPATEAQMKLMLQTLLADRFQLAFHHQDKELKAFVLTIAKGGPRLSPAAAPDAKPLPPEHGQRHHRQIHDHPRLGRLHLRPAANAGRRRNRPHRQIRLRSSTSRPTCPTRKTWAPTAPTPPASSWPPSRAN